MEIVLKEFLDRFVVFFGCLESCFSDYLGFENKLENKAIFCEKLDLKNWIWVRRSMGFWAL